MTPACQWAQNHTTVALAVRYSPKKHGPVSVASVKEPQVVLNESHVSWTAIARPHARREILFALLLELHAPINPEGSSWSVGSAGRLTFSLAKATGGKWPALTKPTGKDTRRGPITIWFEMQEHFGSAFAAGDADESMDAPPAKKKKQKKNEQASTTSVPDYVPTLPQPRGIASRVRAALLRGWRNLRKSWHALVEWATRTFRGV